MAKWKKIVLIILAVLVLAFVGKVVFNYCHIEAWGVERTAKENGFIRYFYYNGEKYFNLYDVRLKTDTYGDVFEPGEAFGAYDIRPYMILSRQSHKVKYIAWDEDVRSTLFVDRVYEYKDDPENNLLYLKSSLSVFIGPDGWFYLKEGYEFPTVYTAEIAGIYITLANGSTFYTPRSDIKLDVTVYDDIINCIMRHEDFRTYLPREDWEGLYIVYKDSPFGEIIARNRGGGIEWYEGGTP